MSTDWFGTSGKFHRRALLAGIAGGLSLAARRLYAGEYRIQPVIDSGMRRPDGGFFFRCLKPSLDGSTLIVRPASVTSGKRDSIWSLDLRDGKVTLLAGLDTIAPNGMRFTGFDGAPPLARDGKALFMAQTLPRQPVGDGLYAVPPEGGAIRQVADYSAANPCDGSFSFEALAAPPPGFSMADGRVVFESRCPGVPSSILIASMDGLGTATLAGPGLSSGEGPALSFRSPAISRLAAAFGADPSAPTGAASLFAIRLDIAESRTEAVPVFEETPLPGNPNAAFATRIALACIGADGDSIAFTGFDANSRFKGIFLYSLDDGGLTAAVTSSGEFAPLGPIDPEGSFDGFAYREGRLAFKVQDESGRSGLFLWSGGEIRHVIDSTEKINGQSIRFLDGPGAGGLSASGALACWAALVVTGPGQPDEAVLAAYPELE